MDNTKSFMPTDSFQELSTQSIDFYRTNGFVRIREIISREEAAQFQAAALRYADQHQSYRDDAIFMQLVNVWQEDDALKQLTLHPNVAAAATQLARVKLRLWHDQLLIKPPGQSKATEFHQDQPYWPHADSPNPISCWIALCDVPVERGCMSFLPGSHRQTELTAQRLDDAKSLFSMSPELQWSERVTVPLRAGDCTFHHGRCAHMATPNLTDQPRVAHVAIFMDATTRYSGKGHVVTNPLQLEAGAPLDGELFPAVS